MTNKIQIHQLVNETKGLSECTNRVIIKEEY